MAELTPERRATIDAMTYQQMLSAWRFAPSGDPIVGEIGPAFDHFKARMEKLRAEGADHVGASKAIGW